MASRLAECKIIFMSSQTEEKTCDIKETHLTWIGFRRGMIWLLIYKRENTMDNTNRCLWPTRALNEVLEPFTIVKKTSTLRGDGKNHW
jgi:hypothetical protein